MWDDECVAGWRGIRHVGEERRDAAEGDRKGVRVVCLGICTYGLVTTNESRRATDAICSVAFSHPGPHGRPSSTAAAKDDNPERPVDTWAWRRSLCSLRDRERCHRGRGTRRGERGGEGGGERGARRDRVPTSSRGLRNTSRFEKRGRQARRRRTVSGRYSSPYLTRGRG